MIKIQLHELSSVEQEKKLLSGELDIAFMEKPTNKQIKYTDCLLYTSDAADE